MSFRGAETELMATLTAEDRTALTDALRRLLADQSSEAQVRQTMETESGYDPALWRQLTEMGVVGLVIEEAYGGAGLGPVELELVMEEAGAALLCSPLISSGVLAAGLLQALNDDEAKGRLLPAIAAGEQIATAAITGPRGGWTEEDVAVRADTDGADWTLTGEASFVTHGQVADEVLVAARTREGVSIFEVDPRGGGGVTVTALPAFDHTLRLARIDFAEAPARPLAHARPAWEAVEAAMDLALVALAGEQAGGARRVLDMTVDYAKLRIQFGRPIGSFQAIKHMAADMLLDTESAISAARHAAKALAERANDAEAAVSLAAFACADAFSQAAAASIQMHGGIAFTWAHPAHLYLRRARADAQLFGAPAFHRDRFVAQLGG
jgi:alkylation response protein AidB-like acyl-CoA dehydrogenase